MVRHFSGILSHRETRAGGGGTLTRAAGSAAPTEAAAHLFDPFFSNCTTLYDGKYLLVIIIYDIMIDYFRTKIILSYDTLAR